MQLFVFPNQITGDMFKFLVERGKEHNWTFSQVLDETQAYFGDDDEINACDPEYVPTDKVTDVKELAARIKAAVNNIVALELHFLPHGEDHYSDPFLRRTAASGFNDINYHAIAAAVLQGVTLDETYYRSSDAAK